MRGMALLWGGMLVRVLEALAVVQWRSLVVVVRSRC
jgi:hypothetical protein